MGTVETIGAIGAIGTMPMVVTVHRKTKAFAGAFKICMIVLAVIFGIGGVLINRGLMLPCFLMAGLYFAYDFFSNREYEYIYDGKTLKIDVIRGGRNRVTAHELNLADLIVAAPHESEAVRDYRKGAPQGNIPKFDYTSYEAHVPYHTMIIVENEQKIKLLLDLSREMYTDLKRRYPSKVS